MADSGKEKRTRGTSASSSSSKAKQEKAPKSGKSRGKGVTVGDPLMMSTEELVKRLEEIDLTEDETEELLQEAYRINKILKKQLDLQNQPAPLERSQTIQAGDKGQFPPSKAKLPPIQTDSAKAETRLAREATLYGGKQGSPTHSKSLSSTPVSHYRYNLTQRPLYVQC